MFVPFQPIQHTFYKIFLTLLIVSSSFLHAESAPTEGLPLFYWGEDPEPNFGDHLSVKLVERIVDRPLRVYKKKKLNTEKKLLAIGSILYAALDEDVVWGSGMNGKHPTLKDYHFNRVDVRAVRGPITRAFLLENFGIEAPEVYGDPALLVPYLFPEFTRSENPTYDYVVVAHYRERRFFPRAEDGHVVHATDPWDEVINKILDSRFVIAGSMHALIVAEAFGIPARLLRVTETEPLLKYKDYYSGTGRPDFQFATSVEEALEMGGEPLPVCDLEKLYYSFPFEFWPNSRILHPDFSQPLVK